jgi:dTDP-glucose 4,6-dehydratase
LPNIDVIRRLLRATGRGEDLIEHVTDRPGHDRRYALSSVKLMQETGWQPQMDFDTGLARTIEWYQTNQPWLQRVRSGEYQKFYEANYSRRNIGLRPAGLS